MAKDSPVPILNGEVLVDPASTPTTAVVHEMTKKANGVPREPIHCDVIVVGGGFSGITAIHRFRKIGMNVKCFESGSELGGVWNWNRYPGARVDSEAPFYQLNIPEVYRHWSFSQRFPDHRELRQYMAHINKVLNIEKDMYYNARVNDCSWNESTHQWTVKTLQGHTAVAKYLISCSGLLHRTYTPDFPGLEDYKGEIYHSAAWKEEFSGKGKKIAIIGAGATAVQITQELGKQADELTVFLRRPSNCLPMVQRMYTKGEQDHWKTYYPALFRMGRDSAGGFPGTPIEQPAQDLSPEEQEAVWEELFERGGFSFLVANFANVMTDKEANKLAYNFWRKKVCQRLTDPKKQKIMAPEIPPYYICTKRTPLEQDYYEVLNQPNVHIHDLKANPLKSFSANGIITSDDHEHAFDAVVLATGFDSYTGSLTHMGLKSKSGTDIKDLWKDGLNTYFGIAVSGFPNFFMAYTPQAPTPLSNGPTIIEAQVETIVDIIKKAEKEGAVTIEPEREGEEAWKNMLKEMVSYTLIPHTDSWWNGANIPGKKAENMLYVNGINNYEKDIRDSMREWEGWNVVAAKA